MSPKSEKTVVFRPRFNAKVDSKLRDRIYRRGELLQLIILILKTVDLSTVPLLELSEDIQKWASTTVELPLTLHAKLKRIAGKRKSSMNILVNSAVLAYTEKEDEESQ